MTTHRRAWRLRAGVVLALVTGALFALPAAPAVAADPTVQITSLSSGTLRSGERATMSFSVTNNNPQPTSFEVGVDVFDGLSCGGDCDTQKMIPGNGAEQFTVTLTAANLAAGQTKSGKVVISAVSPPDRASAERAMTVRGPDQPQQPQTVVKVCGKVTDSNTGDEVANATVALRDSQDHTYTTSSSSSGTFCINGSSQRPIAPGTLRLGASKNEITTFKTLSATAGQSVTGQRLALALPAATPSATPSLEATTPAELTSEEPGAEPTEGAPSAATQRTADEGGGLGQWLLIIVGGLLVALGVGAIVLLWMRRKENDDEDDGGPGAPTAGPRPAVPPSQGVYHGADDRTRMHQGGADPTMMGGAALADAPTMMHNRPLVDDEFPDPYGAPLPSQQPGYGQQSDWAGGGYGDAAAPTQPGYGAGYGNAPGSGAGYNNAPGSGAGYGNAPGSGAGYGYDAARGEDGPGARGYGGEQYDDRTGRYGGGGGGDYAQPADPYATGVYQQGEQGGGQGYGSSRPGYGQDGGGYGSGGYGGGYGQDQRGGYGDGGQGAGYGQQGSGGQGGGYGSGGSGGYGEQDQGGGYEQQPGSGGYGGYGQDQRGGYDREQTGGYYDDQRNNRQDGSHRGGRRSVDWLDN